MAAWKETADERKFQAAFEKGEKEDEAGRGSNTMREVRENVRGIFWCLNNVCRAIYIADIFIKFPKVCEK